eukprot:SAG31_NODE_2849_length_4994_cov_2.114694_2_plen_43_part_00
MYEVLIKSKAKFSTITSIRIMIHISNIDIYYWGGGGAPGAAI